MKNIYKIDGTMLVDGLDAFLSGCSFDYQYDETSDTFFAITRVCKKRPDGVVQYPFVRQPTTSNTVSAYDLAVNEGWHLVMNAGVGQGIIIQNGISVTDASPEVHEGALALTIDSNGDLGYLNYTDTAGKAQSIIANGIVSAVCGFFPLIDNYEKCTIPDVAGIDVPTWKNAQRQIVGQYENGDYCIITGEGRNFASSVGFSIERAQDICKQLGLRFAYNCDGGGSTQTVLGTKNINHVYESPTGRKVKSYIVFNGSSQYAIPNAS